MATVTLTLPWPPTVNHYYGRTRNGRVYLKPAGKRYRFEAAVALARMGHPRLAGRVRVHLTLSPPDKRRRDIDNIRKAIYDAISDRPGHRGIIQDDAQILGDAAVFVDLDTDRAGVIVTVIEIGEDNGNQKDRPEIAKARTQKSHDQAGGGETDHQPIAENYRNDLP